MSALRHQRAAEAHGSVECSRCHAREQLDPEADPAVIEQQVRSFTEGHAHGNVSVITPLSSVRGPTRQAWIGPSPIAGAVPTTAAIAAGSGDRAAGAWAPAVGGAAATRPGSDRAKEASRQARRFIGNPWERTLAEAMRPGPIATARTNICFDITRGCRRGNR